MTKNFFYLGVVAVFLIALIVFIFINNDYSNRRNLQEIRQNIISNEIKGNAIQTPKTYKVIKDEYEYTIIENSDYSVFIKGPKSALFMYPINNNNKIEWECLGYPSNEILADCR